MGLPSGGSSTAVSEPLLEEQSNLGKVWASVPYIPRRAKRALGSRENSSCTSLIDSEMAGPIKLKLGGMVEGMCENVLAKEFFGSV